MQLNSHCGSTGVRHRDALPRSIACALLVVLQALGQQAWAFPPALSLSHAQQLAVARSRELPALDAAIAAAHESAVAAGQLPDPVLKAGVDNLPVSGPDRYHIGSDFMTMRRVGVMQELTRSDKRELRAAQFERSADKASAEKTLITARIERETALAWLTSKRTSAA